MSHSTEAAVRARAYQLWVESGYADGYQDLHWRQAEREMAERADPAEDETASASAQTLQTGEAGPHSDGVSPHPSVLDPKPGR